MAKLSDLPIGAKVKELNTKYNGNVITWIIADKNHIGYPTNTVTLISEKVLLDRRFDDSTSTYRDSELRRWINNNNGLMRDFSSDFKNSIVSTSVNTEPGNVTDKIFLASRAEVIIKDSAREGYKFPIFTDSNSRIGKDFNNDNRSWWTRTAFNSASRNVQFVTRDGNFYFINPNSTSGIRPVCNLKSDVYISDNADPNGIYNITWNRPPTIESATSSNMGLKTKEFSFTYKVADEDTGQVITVEEYMDNVRTKRFTAQSGSTYTFSLSRPAYQKILNGNHSIKIVVSDDKGGVAEKVFNFSKNETKILVTLDTPLAADAMVTKALINVLGSIPSKAIFKVEACNNAYDANPTWEDCTEKVLNSRKIFFRNNTKTASKWGFNVRVSLDRNGAAGECYISSIGGNFE